MSDVDHRIHFDELGRIFEGDEVGGLSGDVQQQRKGCLIAEILYDAHRRLHGSRFGRTGSAVKMGFLCAHVAEQEAKVRLVGVGRGHAGIGVNVIVHRDIVVAAGGHRHIPLSEHRVDEAADEGPMVIILLHDQVGIVEGVHPGGNLLVIPAFTAHRIDQNRAPDIGSAEQSDRLDEAGRNPPWMSILIDFKFRGGKHKGGIGKTQMAQDIAVQRLRKGIFHPFGQADDGSFLRNHVHHHIGGKTASAVGDPFEEVGIADRSHPHRTALIVDLRGVVRIFELADHVAQSTHLAVAQIFGGGAVKGGNLGKGDLCHILGEAAVLHL